MYIAYICGQTPLDWRAGTSRNKLRVYKMNGLAVIKRIEQRQPWPLGEQKPRAVLQPLLRPPPSRAVVVVESCAGG